MSWSWRRQLSRTAGSSQGCKTMSLPKVVQNSGKKREADCTVENYTSVEQQPEVYITFQGDSRHTYGENLYRLQESEGHLRLTKEFALSATLPNNLDILLRSPVDDVRWHPGTTATLSNILITLEYGK